MISLAQSRLRTFLFSFLVIGLLISVGIVGMTWRHSVSRPKINLLILTLDTTRADRLGCYGYSAASTPTLDAIARSGLRFDRAYSPAPLTLPAHASLFTGLYPPEHGLRTNGRGRLDESLPTLAELLQKAGYDTAAFVSSFVLDKRFGLDRGWSHYDDHTTDATTADALQRQRTAVNVTDSALKWLTHHGERPFCLWIHYYDAHYPYDDHSEEFGDRFQDRPYDAELASIDAQIARVLQQLDTQGLRKNTWIIVVGDHGEGFGDHVERTHGYTLYDSTQRVPFLMEWPDHLTAGHLVHEPVSLIDVLPTVVSQLHLPISVPFRGINLSPSFTAADLVTRPCYSMTDDPFLQNGWSPLRSLVHGDWKYIRTKIPELYNSRTDPGEKENLIEINHDDAARMEVLLDELEQGLIPRTAKRVSLTAREQRALEGLGYLGGRQNSDSSDSDQAPDVKEMLPFDVATQDALTLLQSGDARGAELKLRMIIADSSQHISARIFLGEALERQGRLDEAMTFYAAALHLKRDNIDALIHFGTARATQGFPEEAIAHFDEALRINRDSTDARYNLARALTRIGNLNEARLQLEETLRLDEQFLNAHAALATVLIQQRQIESAISHLRREIEINPQAWEARLNMAVLIAGKDPSAAESFLQEADKISPENPQILYNRGAFLRIRHRPAEAVTFLERAVALSPVPNTRYEEELAKAKAEKTEPLSEAAGPAATQGH